MILILTIVVIYIIGALVKLSYLGYTQKCFDDKLDLFFAVIFWPMMILIYPFFFVYDISHTIGMYNRDCNDELKRLRKNIEDLDSLMVKDAKKYAELSEKYHKLQCKYERLFQFFSRKASTKLFLEFFKGEYRE